ncbi:MAG TPA: pantothenate kinase, partial [Coleofasciculaceae cyanobacterium]
MKGDQGDTSLFCESASESQNWLALMIGNSRLHWAWFVDTTLQHTWNTNYLSTETVEKIIQDWASGVIPSEILPPPRMAQQSPKTPAKTLDFSLNSSFGRLRASPIMGDFVSDSGKTLHHGCQLPLYLASVVPAQTTLWQTCPTARVITLEQLPLQGLYPTLGIDRALAVLGAGETLGYPVLVIDAGTALTFTGADAHRQLIGGAILPGLRLQFQALAQGTAALPTVQLPTQLPPRWANQTSSAIESGIIYTV